LEQAKRTGDQVLSLARERRERGFEAWILRLQGDIARATALFDDACMFYKEALASAIELEMRPLVAHCHTGLGDLRQRTGKPQEARNHFATATTLYREMGMTYWLRKVDAEIGTR
jgi:tetratricopeptide repeat protein